MSNAVKKTLVKEVSFDIEGKFVADLARSRVEEGAWEAGLRLLLDSFMGMTHEQAILLLKGEADMTGWASDPEGVGMDVLGPDNPLAHKMNQRLDFLYGSTFRVGDDYWMPYAIVEGWCRVDMVFSGQYAGSFRAEGNWQDRRSALRSLFYADNRDSDMVVLVPVPSDKHGTVVLCQKAAMPPIWMRKENTTSEAVLTKMLKEGKRWAVRGAPDDVRETATVEALQAAESELKAEEASPTQEKNASIDESIRKIRAAKAANALVSEYAERVSKCTSSAELSALGREFEGKLNALDTHDGAVYDRADVEVRDVLDSRMESLWREAIEKQADEQGGWLDLKLMTKDDKPYPEKYVLRVPRNPFILWALRGFDFGANGKERPVWVNVCPMGAKMMMDNPDHSDWMVGAGVSLADTYSIDDESFASIVMSSAYQLRHELVEEITQAQFVTLAKDERSFISGDAVFPGPNESVEPGSIAIVPAAGPQYQLAMESACKPDKHGQRGAVICNTGGKLAHLAIVGRELNCTVLMLPNATERFTPGQRIYVDMESGSLRGFFI